jgi:hypothetical protein
VGNPGTNPSGEIDPNSTDISTRTLPPLPPNHTTAPTTLTEPPITTSGSVRLVFRAALQLSGTFWSPVLADPKAKANLERAFRRDLASLLLVAEVSVQLLNLFTDGNSLIVAFGVIQGSPRTPSQLANSFAAAGMTTLWLTNVLAQYHNASQNETVFVVSTGVAYAATPFPTLSGAAEQMNPRTVLVTASSSIFAAALLCGIMSFG